MNAASPAATALAAKRRPPPQAGPVVVRSGGCTDAALDPVPQIGGRLNRRHQSCQGHELSLPVGDLRGEGRILRHAAFGRRRLGGLEHAQHIFGCERLSALLRCRSWRQALLQAKQTSPDPGFDRADRHGEARRQLAVREPFHKRQNHQLPPLRCQHIQAAAQRPAFG